MNIIEHIKEKRPNLAGATVKTYASLLKSMFYKAHDKDVPFNVEWFEDSEAVLAVLADKTPQTRKTNIAAVVVLLDKKKNPEYSKVMSADADYTKEQYAKQEKTEKQSKNWMDFADVKAMWQTKYDKLKHILARKEAIDEDEKHDLVKFMIMTVASGIFFPPRRSEWISTKVSNYDPKTDNYLDLKNSQFVFNKFKTAKTMGQEVVKFPKEFRTILMRYLKIVDINDHLIFNTHGKPYTNAGLAQQLNTIFGKKISTGMLRHIWISNKYKDMPSLAELKETADSLGHSPERMMEYIVRDKIYDA